MKSKEQCCKDVRTQGTAIHYHPCPYKATVTRDGKHYCKIHDPVEAAKRDKARDAKYTAQWARKEKMWARERAAFKALALLEAITNTSKMPPTDWWKKAERIVKEANK